MRKKSSFTLVEVLIVIIVLAMLAAIAIPIYQNKVEQVRIDICTANQEALLEAVKIYEMENDALPGSLAKVWRKNGEEALAIVWERKKKEGDYTYLAYLSFQRFRYFLANIFSINPLYAQPSFSSTLADKGILRCPSDTGPRTRWSYTLNGDAVEEEEEGGGRRRRRHWRDIPVDTLIIADTDSDGNIAGRHTRGGSTVAVVTDKEGDHFLRSKEGETGIGRGGVAIPGSSRGHRSWIPPKRNRTSADDKNDD